MSEYNISLGVILEADDLQRIRTQINRLELDPITVQLDTSRVQSQINNIRRQIQQLGNIRINLGGTGSGGIGNGVRGVADVARAYRELISLQNRIGTKQQAVAKLDTTQNQREIMELSTQIDNLYGKYQRLHSLFSGHFSAEQVDSLNRGFQITSERLDVVNRKVADVKANLATKIQNSFGDYTNQLSALEGRFNNLATKPPELQTGIERVRQALSTLASADSTDALIAANKDYINVLKQVETEIKRVEIAEKQSNDDVALQQQKQALALKISNWLRENSAAAKQFGGEIQNLRVQLDSCGNIKGVQQVGRQFDIVKGKAKEAGVAAMTFGDRLKKQFAQYSSYVSVYSLFMYATRAMKSMFEQVKLIDSAMTELKKVTDESAESYNKFLTNAATRAREIGTTIDGLVSSTADFARLGYGFEDAQGLAEVANIYAVVGDEVEGVQGATESLISTMAAFKDSADEMSNTDFAMSIIDKFNEIGNNFAISSGGIGESMKRSASSLMAANNTIDESIALITAANTVVQDPAQVGTAFKTISMRIRGAKTE